jgi:hypothetical protein
MKTIKYLKIVIIILIGLTSVSISAQCYNNLNTQSTDWRNYPTTSDNNWNWTLSGAIHPVYLSNNLSNPSLFIELPYFCTKPPGTGSCDGHHNVESYQYRGNSASDQDINPEDGWELLLKDFGSPNPVGQDNGGSGRNNPYFILYNKYTGKMKIYIAMMGIHSRQSTFVRIGFDNPDPGTTKLASTNEANRALFSNAEPIQKTILEFKPILEFKQMNQVMLYQDQLTYQWSVCELTTSYDPCTCINPTDHMNKISTLRMQLVNVGIINIDANIDGKSTPENTANSNNTKSTVDGSLASFFKVATGAGNAAQKGRKDWESTQKTMNQIIDFGNDVLIKHLAKEWLKKDNPNFDDATINTLNKSALKDLLSAPDSIKKMFGVRQPSNSNLGKVLEASKGIVSNLPYIGMAIGIVDFLLDGGEETQNNEQSGPVTYDINLKLTGTLTESQFVADFSCHTPGSPIPSNNGTHLTPIYNNILGVFNVFELPELEYAELSSNLNREHVVNRLSSVNLCQFNYDNFNNLENANDIKFRQYRPKSNVKYVINPASDLEVISIDAAIVFDFKQSENLFPKSIKNIQNSIAIPFHSDMAFFNNQIPLLQRVKSIENSSNLKLEFVSKNYPTDTQSFVRFRTNYIPITCFTNHDFTLLGTNNFGGVFIKLYIKLKRKNSPNSEPITIVQTFDWKEKIKNATKINDLSGSYSAFLFANTISSTPRHFKCNTDLFNSRNYSDYIFSTKFELLSLPFNNMGMYRNDNYNYSNEQFLTVEDRLIIPSGANIPNNSIIKAGGLITIKPNVNFGNNVKIISSTKIEFETPNVINPDVEFLIQSLNELLYGCNNFDFLSLHNTSSEISQYCNKFAYKELVYSSQTKRKNNTKNYTENNVDENNIIFKLSPNPTTANFTVSIFNNNEQDYSIALMDVTGKVLFNNSYNGKQTSQFIETNGLAAGIYFVRITCGNTQKTEKLIISGGY